MGKESKLWNRGSLKGFFRKGQMPSEVHFGYLIDSTVNIVEDGISKSDKEGLQLSPTNDANTVMSIYKSLSDPNPNWQVSLQDNETGTGLSFDSIEQHSDGHAKADSKLFLSKSGRIGIGTSMPRTHLEVNGSLGASTRIGTFLIGEQPGDGEWHDVISGLDGPQAFEVVAGIEGPSGRGKHAITHATALITFGGSNHRIKQVRAYFGWFWNRIDFRWHGETRNFSLQVRTRSHYGMTPNNTNFMIRYHVTRLWDTSIF